MAENFNDNFNIPIQRTDLSILDDAVSCIREKFFNEMRIMNEEMNKLNSELMQLYAQTPDLKLISTESNESQSPSRSRGNWESLAHSPLVDVEGQNKTLKLQFDVSQFDPTEVTVKIQNETLIISATHEDKREGSSLLRQYYREMKLPKGIEPSTVNSMLSKDGILMIQAPLPQLSIVDASGKQSRESKDPVL